MIKSLSIEGFRNYDSCFHLDIESSWVGVTGANGSGKTNLLEALFFICRQRGFRNDPWTRLRTWDKTHGSVYIDFDQFDRQVSWNNQSIQFREDGDLVKSRRLWAEKIPIFGYRPDDDLFFHEQPLIRRRYLDWLCSYLNPAYINLVAHYERTLKQRNAALRTATVKDKEFDIWDSILAESGSELHTVRLQVSIDLQQTYQALWADLGHEAAVLRYVPGGSGKNEEAQKMLRDQRDRDRQRGWTAFGPHRDDLLVERYDRPIRESGSQGYRKLAVILLSVACAKDAGDSRQLFYLDDIEGELDDDNEYRLFNLLGQQNFHLYLSGVRRPRFLERVDALPPIQWIVL